MNKKTLLTISTFLIGLAAGLAIREISSLEAKAISAIPRNEFSIANGPKSLPKSFQLIQRSCYSLNYDCRTRNASWVYERITADSLKGNVDRESFKFKEDPAIPEIFRSTLKDYQGSGFDRGHLAPAANQRNNAEAMADTFYLSNMSPQMPQFNRGYWSKLEKHVRNLTNSYESVEVFTGPLFLPQEDKNGSRWVRYQVIGQNDVAVPTHFYKVIVLGNYLGTKNVEAYILPNEAIETGTPLNKFKVTVQKVERAAGMIFFSDQLL